MNDILVGDRATTNTHLCALLSLFDTSGRIQDFTNFKVLIHQLYYADLKVNFQQHPILLAVPFSWTEEEKTLAQKSIFELGIPLACLVDSAKLLCYNYSKPSCLLLNISSSGVCCVPMTGYEPNSELKKFVHVEIDKFVHSLGIRVDYYDNSYNVSRKLIAVPPFAVDKVAVTSETQKEWNEFEAHLPEGTIQVGYYEEAADEGARLDCGEKLFARVFETVISVIESIVNLEEKEFFLKNILVTGGFSAVYGMKERLTRELTVRYPSCCLTFAHHDMDVIGGARIFTSLHNFKQHLETK